MNKNFKRVLALVACLLLSFSLVACGGGEGGGDKVDNKKMIDAVGYGVDTTGATDMTQKMVALHKEAAKQGKMVYYPNGTYLFNGATLDFSTGVKFESQDGVLIRNSISDTPIVNFDKSGALIGLMHNHLEDSKGFYVISGSIVSPPLSEANVETEIDMVPYWYNDFGLQSSGGAETWFTWDWNYQSAGTRCTNCGGKVAKGENPYAPGKCATCGQPGTVDQYDATRHPLLGWYRGDEVEVLDWQAYWLLEHGMNQTILLGHVDPATWDDRNNSTYWVNQLLNKTKNGQKMKFALQVASSNYGATEAEVRTAWWTDFQNFYLNETYKDRVYTYNKDGKEYAVISLWDEQSLRFGMGNRNNGVGEALIIQLYKDVAQTFKEKGFDGICILARTPCFTTNTAVIAELAAHDILWYSAGYPSNYLGSGVTYEDRVNGFYEPASTDTVYAVAMGLHTHDPHPSQWVCPGNTPELFNTWITKAINSIKNNPARPKMITCYNVSEWHEGGAGLAPTVGDGYAYLEAIKAAVEKK